MTVICSVLFDMQLIYAPDLNSYSADKTALGVL